MKIKSKYNVGRKVWIIENTYYYELCSKCGERHCLDNKTTYQAQSGIIKGIEINVGGLFNDSNRIKIKYEIQGSFRDEIGGGCINEDEDKVYCSEYIAKNKIKSLLGKK